jgi:hypothetical protein
MIRSSAAWSKADIRPGFTGTAQITKSGTAMPAAERTKMGSYKKIGWTDADVRCPFYITDDRETRSISCEGFGKGVDAVSRFQTIPLMDRHMGLYCVGRFEDCPVYRCTYGCKYQD